MILQSTVHLQHGDTEDGFQGTGQRLCGDSCEVLTRQQITLCYSNSQGPSLKHWLDAVA